MYIYIYIYIHTSARQKLEARGQNFYPPKIHIRSIFFSKKKTYDHRCGSLDCGRLRGPRPRLSGRTTFLAFGGIRNHRHLRTRLLSNLQFLLAIGYPRNRLEQGVITVIRQPHIRLWMLIYVIVLVALLWLRRVWVTRYSRKSASKEFAPSSGSECEADLLESGLSVELKGRKRVHVASEATPLPLHSSTAFVRDASCRFSDAALGAPCSQPILKTATSRPMSPTQLLTVTKALQMELQSAALNPKQLPQHRKKIIRPFIGSVAARRAKNREHYTAQETSSWQPPPLITESPLFPPSKISNQSESLPPRPKLHQIRAGSLFASQLVNEIDTEDDAWAKSGRNPVKDPRWWTLGVVRAVSRKDLGDYFIQQDVMLYECNLSANLFFIVNQTNIRY